MGGLLRDSHPWIGSVLLDRWHEARAREEHPVAAWAALVDDGRPFLPWQEARGTGDFRRCGWDEALEVAAAALLFTAWKYGPDRVFGLSGTRGRPCLAWSAASRFLHLFGGVFLDSRRSAPDDGTAPWSSLALARDWVSLARRQPAETWYYVQGEQWRYEPGHRMDREARSVRLGWASSYPQFNRNSLDLAPRAREAGAEGSGAMARWAAEALEEAALDLAIDDPAAVINRPRVLVAWRGGRIVPAGDARECFLRHGLGARDGPITPDLARETLETVHYRKPSMRGKLDLAVSIATRIGAAERFSDLILPDSPDGDRHLFRALACKVSELAPRVFRGPVQDVVMVPLEPGVRNAPGAKPRGPDWRAQECEPIPGVTMPRFEVVWRDYVRLYCRFSTFGPAYLAASAPAERAI